MEANGVHGTKSRDKWTNEERYAIETILKAGNADLTGGIVEFRKMCPSSERNDVAIRSYLGTERRTLFKEHEIRWNPRLLKRASKDDIRTSSINMARELCTTLQTMPSIATSHICYRQTHQSVKKQVLGALKKLGAINASGIGPGCTYFPKDTAAIRRVLEMPDLDLSKHIFSRYWKAYWSGAPPKAAKQKHKVPAVAQPKLVAHAPEALASTAYMPDAPLDLEIFFSIVGQVHVGRLSKDQGYDKLVAALQGFSK